MTPQWLDLLSQNCQLDNPSYNYCCRMRGMLVCVMCLCAGVLISTCEKKICLISCVDKSFPYSVVFLYSYSTVLIRYFQPFSLFFFPILIRVYLSCFCYCQIRTCYLFPSSLIPYLISTLKDALRLPMQASPSLQPNVVRFSRWFCRTHHLAECRFSHYVLVIFFQLTSTECITIPNIQT